MSLENEVIKNEKMKKRQVLQYFLQPNSAPEEDVVPNEGNPVFTPHKSLVQTAPTMIKSPGILQ